MNPVLWVTLLIVGILFMPLIGYVLFVLFACFITFWQWVLEKLDIWMCKILPPTEE